MALPLLGCPLETPSLLKGLQSIIQCPTSCWTDGYVPLILVSASGCGFMSPQLGLMVHICTILVFFGVSQLPWLWIQIYSSSLTNSLVFVSFTLMHFFTQPQCQILGHCFFMAASGGTRFWRYVSLIPLGFFDI